MSWIIQSLSRALWALWRCFPKPVRLAVYHWAERRYGVSGYGIRIRMLPFGLVSKKGMHTARYEADSIRFVANNTSIPVPRILDAIEYTTSSLTPRGFILMTRLEGVPLTEWLADRAIRPPGSVELFERMDNCLEVGDHDGFAATIEQIKALPLPILDLSDAGPLIQDLRNAFKELRSLPPPDSFAVAGVSGGPVLCNRAGDTEFIGPFRDQQEFKDHIFAQANSILFPHRMPALRRLAEPVNAKRHRTCFTHADLAARNILVKNGRLSGIIDWEFAGWYPEYWELVTMEMQMMRESLSHQFWDAVQPFGPEPYQEELALEWALWCCSGTTAVVNDAGDDLSCPRVNKSAVPIAERATA